MKTTEMTTQAEELRAGETIIVNTVGTSMQPLLYENDTQAVVSPLRGPLKAGDLVLYENEAGDPVIHRVSEVSGDTVRIRGDNVYLEESVPRENIAGLVTEIFRHGRRYRTEDRGMRWYGRLVIGIFPFRKAARGLRRKVASALPPPAVKALRKMLGKLRT